MKDTYKAMIIGYVLFFIMFYIDSFSLLTAFVFGWGGAAGFGMFGVLSDEFKEVKDEMQRL